MTLRTVRQFFAIHTRIRLAARLLCGVALVAGTALNFGFILRTGNGLACYNLGVDTDKYHGAALHIVESDSVEVPALQPPGYILYLAFLYRLVGPRVLVPKLLAGAMILAMSMCLWWFGWRFAHEPDGMIAAILTIFSPALRAYAATLQYEVPAAFLFLASMALTLAGAHSTTRRSMPLLVTGAFTGGLAALTRETFLPIFLVLLSYVFFRSGGARGERWLRATVAGLVFAATVGGWVSWQSWKNGRFIPISEKGTMNLEIGNNPNANGTYNQTLKPVLQPAGWAFIERHPKETGRLALRKFGYFWGVLKDGWNVPRGSALFFSRLTLGAVSLSSSATIARSLVPIVALLGGVVVLFSRRLRRDFWILPGVLAVTVGIHMLTLSSFRFAVPVLPVVYLLTGIGAVVAARWITKRLETRWLIVVLVVLAGWAGFALASQRTLRLDVEGEELDGVEADDVRDSEASNGLARFADRVRGRREMAILTEEFLPSGPFRVTVYVKAVAPGGFVELLIPLSEGGVAIREKLEVSGGGNYESHTVMGRLTHDAAAKVILVTEGNADIWLDRVEIRAGIPIEELRFSHTLFGNDQTSEEVLDLGSPGFWTEYEQEGWSENEKWGNEFTFQWSEGRRSTLALPIAEARDLYLDFRASPFSLKDLPPQRLHLRLNGREIAAMTLQDGWNWYSVAIEKGALYPGVNRLDFLHERASRPADFPGNGTDVRRLAAAYDVMKLRRR